MIEATTTPENLQIISLVIGGTVALILTILWEIYDPISKFSQKKNPQSTLVTVGVESLPRKDIFINKDSYAVHIGYLYSDLIDDWKREGIKSLPKALSGRGSPPRAYTAWHSLEQLSTRVTLPLDIKPDLKKFLDYFQTTSSGLVEPLTVYHITTKIKTKPTLNKYKSEIRELAKSLEERLKDVTR